MRKETRGKETLINGLIWQTLFDFRLVLHFRQEKKIGSEKLLILKKEKSRNDFILLEKRF